MDEGKKKKRCDMGYGTISFTDFIESEVKWTPEQGGYQPVQYSRFRSGIFYVIWAGTGQKGEKENINLI